MSYRGHITNFKGQYLFLEQIRYSVLCILYLQRPLAPTLFIISLSYMDIKHSDPKLSVEEAWLTITICIYMGAGSITPHQLI
jgi:hypothetical protein